MHEHPQFAGMLFHDDDELGAALGSRVASRALVHEWPLTRTEDVRLDDGRRYAYKTQLPPTVEQQFYEQASSSLLAPFRDLGQAGASSFLAVEWIDAPTLYAPALEEGDFIAQARQVVDGIGGITGAPPVFLDLSTPDALGSAAGITAERLASLIRSGRFARVPSDSPSRIEEWARAMPVVEAAASNPRVTHGDLSPEEVFRTADGYRVIDWQRPVRGPADLDLVSLLRYRRIEPLLYVHAEVVELSWFVLLHWAALVQTDLLPDLAPTIPEGWALAALPHILNPGGQR